MHVLEKAKESFETEKKGKSPFAAFCSLVGGATRLLSWLISFVAAQEARETTLVANIEQLLSEADAARKKISDLESELKGEVFDQYFIC